MATLNFGNFIKELQKVDKEEGLSFEDKQLVAHTAEDVKDIVEALEKTKVVHYLKLSGNTFGVPAAAAIGKALESHSEFRKALWRNMFTSRLKNEIPIAIESLGKGLIIAKAQLVVLDLSDNALGPNGMVGLQEFLRSPVCFSLRELHLNNCGLGIDGADMLSKALLDCQKASIAAGKPLNLKVFDTGRNRLENKGALSISKVFAELKTLEEVTMPQNFICHEGIQSLAKGLKSNPGLRVLNLNDNTVIEKGATHLADLFANTPLLRVLNLGDCMLRTNGALLLADVLADNHLELESLDFSFNEINVESGLETLNAMINKPKLKYINLNGNNFGQGRARIEELVKEFPKEVVFVELDEDNSSEDEGDDRNDDFDENEDDDIGEEEEHDDGDENDDDGDEDEEGEEHYIDNHNNDITQEANDDDYDVNYDDYDEDESVGFESQLYVTSPAYDTVMMAANESITSNNVTAAQKQPIAVVDLKNFTAKEFCLSRTPCTLEMFNSIKETNKLEAFRNVINEYKGDEYLLVLIFTALKCGNLSKSSTIALEISKELFKESIDYAVKTKQERRVLNHILKQLGLLRSEIKFNDAYNTKSCRDALRETLKVYSDKIASDYMKNAFSTFLKEANETAEVAK